MGTRFSFTFVAVVVLQIALIRPADAAVLKSQHPCSTDPCALFGLDPVMHFNVPPPNPVRTISLTAPSAGTALVLMNGTLYCVNTGTKLELLDLESQIVDNPSATAMHNRPGGARYSTSLPTFDQATQLTGSLTFNLASQRVFTVPAPGTYTYYFKFSVNRLDSEITCYLYNDTLSVLFTP